MIKWMSRMTTKLGTKLPWHKRLRIHMFRVSGTVRKLSKTVIYRHHFLFRCSLSSYPIKLRLLCLYMTGDISVKRYNKTWCVIIKIQLIQLLMGIHGVQVIQSVMRIQCVCVDHERWIRRPGRPDSSVFISGPGDRTRLQPRSDQTIEHIHDFHIVRGGSDADNSARSIWLVLPAGKYLNNHPGK